MAPSISSRAYIQWLPNPPSEPTSTLVLTSTQRHFVDIRISKDKACASTKPELAASDIDWAFAGDSTSHSANGKSLSQWHHWVDSKNLTPEEVVDKGEMLPGDADGLALEKGEMVNPATGLMTEYVEGWREVEAGVVPAVVQDVVDDFVVELLGRQGSVEGLEGQGGVSAERLDDDRSGKRVSVVLRNEDVAKRSRGMAVRVGHLCQGVVRVGDEFALERWEWNSESGWRRSAVHGRLSLPCDAMNILGDTMTAETTIMYGSDGDDYVWRCIEAERF